MPRVIPFAFSLHPASAPVHHVLTQPVTTRFLRRCRKILRADPHNLIAVEKGRAYPSDTPPKQRVTARSRGRSRIGFTVKSWAGPRHLFMRTR